MLPRRRPTPRLTRRAAGSLLTAGALWTGLTLASPPRATADGADGASPTDRVPVSPSTVGHDAARPSSPDPETMAQHAADRTVIDVTDHGADPTGDQDSAAAVQHALAAVHEVDGPVTLSFPEGVYQLFPEQAARRQLFVSNTTGADLDVSQKRIGVLLEDREDVIVEGHGSTLVFHGSQTQFAALRSSDVTIRGLSTRWDTPATLDLTVIGSGTDGAGYRDVRMPDGVEAIIDGEDVAFQGERSPATAEPYWRLDLAALRAGHNQVRDLATGATERSQQLWDGVTAVTALDGSTLRITYGETDEDPGLVGTVHEFRRTLRDTPAMLFFASRRTDVVDVDLGYLHGFGIVAQMTESVTLDRLRVRTAAGSGRHSAAFADFVQASGVSGTVQVTNSLFDNPHDDPINVHGTYLQVEAVDRDERTVTLGYQHPETAGFPQFSPGDTLRFVDRDSMLPLAEAEAVVVSVDGPSGYDTDHDLRTMTVELDRDLPADLATGSVVAENLTMTPTVRIAGNTFRSVPTRGVLVTSPRSVLIERNRFERVTMASIFISGDANSWYESGAVRDVTIRENIFDSPSTAQGVILVEPTNTVFDEERSVHSGLTVERNEFAVLPGTTILDARSVGDIAVRRNRVSHAVPPADPAASPVSGAALYRFDHATDIRVSGNAYAPGINRRAELSGTDPQQVLATDGTVLDQDSVVPGTDPDAESALAAAITATWEGVEFPGTTSDPDRLAVLDEAVDSVHVDLSPAHEEDGTTMRVVVDDVEVATSGTSAAIDVPLAPGATVLEVRSLDRSGNRQNYRWVLLSLKAPLPPDAQGSAGC